MAMDKAAQEYDVFNKTQKITSDFDHAVAMLTGKQELVLYRKSIEIVIQEYADHIQMIANDVQL